MKSIINLLITGALATAIGLALPACNENAKAASSPDKEASASCPRLISLDGAITEVLFELGHGACLAGIDVTSTYPGESLKQVAQLGHVSRLNAEAVLQLKPELILTMEAEKDNPVLLQLQKSGIECLFLKKPYSPGAPLQMAAAISEKLGEKQGLDGLKAEMEADRDALEKVLAQTTGKPRVLFIYARGKGNLMVAGRNTAAEAMISLAGGENALTDFEDFRALSTEGLIQAQPDAILMFSSGLESLDGVGGLLGIPGIAQTPAGKNKNIIVMEGQYLLGFGPRCLQAARELAIKIHGLESI